MAEEDRPSGSARRPSHQAPSQGSQLAAGSRQPARVNAPPATRYTPHNTPVNYQPPPNSFPQMAFNSGGYGGQYTITPPGLNLGHTPPPFGYNHGFHPGGGTGPTDASLLSSHHMGYPNLMSHGHVYSYQPHSPESVPHHNNFPPAPSHPVYPHGPLNPSPPLQSPQPIAGQGGIPPTGQYSSHGGNYRATNYQPPISPSQYGYAVQAYTPSPPIYQTQYAQTNYTQSYAQGSEQDFQGTWWYVPTVVPGQYEGVQLRQQPSFQGHYPLGYGQPGTTGEMDQSYVQHLAQQDIASPLAATQVSPLEPPKDPALKSAAAMVSTTTPQQPGKSDLPTQSREKPMVRRSYHPNPPSQRSEWVMWAGNVPADASHDELWQFFNQPIIQETTEMAMLTMEDTRSNGVVSIFLIARSNCAFVNFETEEYLLEVIARFNGQPLRTNDPRCPRLVCRVRRQDDDLKAGVGGQRGAGIHSRWVKEFEVKMREMEAAAETTTGDSQGPTFSSVDEQLASGVRRVSLSSDESPHRARSAGSYASTSSSLLTHYFPQRYFILKSLTQYDLDLSVETGLWATQKHNEGILDQAFRTSKDVFLIFGVNKSGEFYGYARMTGSILQGERRVSWASRTDSAPSSRSSISPITGRTGSWTQTIPEEPSSPGQPTAIPPMYFSPSQERMVEESPLPFSPAQGGSAVPLLEKQPMSYAAEGPSTPHAGPRGQSAPAELVKRHHKFTAIEPKEKFSLTGVYPQVATATAVGAGSMSDFELDPEAPGRAVRSSKGTTSEDQSSKAILQKVEEEVDKPDLSAPTAVAAGESDKPREEGWGESFKIEWINTERLPFYRTRHLRNPWNQDREIKVSRDGTEIEPGVGQLLLDEWARPNETKPPVSVTKRGGPGK